MTEVPDAPPEGVLIKEAAQAAGYSQREAARRAKLSETRWRQLVSGFQRVDGRPVPTRSRDTTLARMARAVGVTAEQLDGAGRPAAAALVREMDAKEAGDAERSAAAAGLDAEHSSADPRTRVDERWYMLRPLLRQAPLGLTPTEHDALRGRIDVFLDQSPEWHPSAGSAADDADDADDASRAPADGR